MKVKKWISRFGLAAVLVLGTVSVAVSNASAQTGFGLEPDSFIAKTHPHVPLETFQSTGYADFANRRANLDGYTDASGQYQPGIRELDPVTEAGAHPDATTHFRLTTDQSGTPLEYARDIILDLPPGFLGNPEAVTACSRDRFEEFDPTLQPGELSEPTCPPSSQVGVITIDVSGSYPLITAPIYRLTRPPSAPAAFGFAFVGGKTVLTPRLRSDGDYGLSLDTSGIISVPYQVRAITATLWGVPAASRNDPDRWNQNTWEWESRAGIVPRPFLINPPRCNTGELATDISMRSWQQPERWVPRDLDDASEAEEYTALSPEPTGCELLPRFEPELDARPVNRSSATPSSYDVELTNTYNDDPEGRAGAHVKRVDVTLPEGVTVSPSAAHGLRGCTDRQAGIGTQSVVNCPDASKIGQVSVETPLLAEPLEGAAYIGAPTRDQLLRMFIILEGFGTVVRIAGDVETDPETGQITAVFDENPQVPFTALKLRFDSGAMAPLVNPTECGAHEIRTEITSWNGEQHVSRSEFSVENCSDERLFDPWLTSGTVNPTTGASSPFLAKFGRSDSDEEMSSVSVDMPEGLLARIAGVPLCESAAADRGVCGEGSRIGHIQIASGAGTQPYWVPGPGKDPTAVYLSGPYEGAPYSLSIVVEAQAGPFDLGRVVVRNPIEVDDRTAELSIGLAESRVYDRFGDLDRVIDNRMPTILEGIPLRAKEIRVIVDREEFMVNPTNCSAKQIEARIGASDGRFTELVSPFRATDCARLDFAPRFGMRILNPGRRSTVRSFNPAMRFGVAPREGDANIAAAAVTLPSSIILDQSNIRTVCTRDQFAARECPQAAIYGYARAWSPLLKEPIQGPVYLGSSDNQLPDLIADMRGEVRVILQGEILGTSDGRIRNVFRFVPDAAVSRFQLNMLGGANRGVLVNSRDLCRSGERGVSRFIGQNGKRQVSRHRVGLSFRGCRQVRRQAAVRQMKRRAVIRKAVRQGQVTPAQARRQIRT